MFQGSNVVGYDKGGGGHFVSPDYPEYYSGFVGRVDLGGAHFSHRGKRKVHNKR